MARRATASIGLAWERRALAHLERAGLELVGSNFRSRMGEIDLIMLDRGCLVFVEVRYRASDRFVSAAHSIGPTKQQRLARAAALFLARHPQFHEHPVRFDVVAFDAARGNDCTLQWLRDAFRPES